MEEKICALLVHYQNESFQALERVLESEGIQTRRANSCSEARVCFKGPNPPHVVFTDTSLADGSWEDILFSASNGRRAVPIILVSRVVDFALYVRALESGAADFIVPPFRAVDIAYIVRCAVGSGTQQSSVAKAHAAAA